MAHTSRLHYCSPALKAAVLIVAFNLVTAVALATAPDVSIPQLQAAAERGHIPQEVELAGYYFSGRGVPQDVKMAAHWYRRAAESGDPEAQNEIGFMYQAGVGVPADPARAMHWYQLSAASGFALAKVNLGVMYVWGVGVPKDEALAMQFFREAASKGNGTAASYLGDMNYFGMGCKQDRTAAENWYVAGEKLHDPFAAYNLSLLFSGKDGHPSNLEKAATLLRESVAQGYVPAMYSLGLLLVNHPDLTQGPQEARSELETASDAGSWKASVVLGVLARDGRGTNANPEDAYYRFQIAILQGGEPVKQLLFNDLKALTPKLSTERTTVLNSEANAWFQQHPMILAFVNRNNDNWKRFPAWARTADSKGLYAGQLVPPPPA